MSAVSRHLKIIYLQIEGLVEKIWKEAVCAAGDVHEQYIDNLCVEKRHAQFIHMYVPLHAQDHWTFQIIILYSIRILYDCWAGSDAT